MVSFSGAAAPGPLLLTVIRESVGRDLRVGGLLSVGHALIELPVVLLLGLGLLDVDPTNVMLWLGTVGGMVLIAFGLLTLRSSTIAPLPGVSAAPPERRPGYLSLVLLGGITSASNPYWTLWWLTIGVAYVVQALVSGPLGLLAFYLSHIAGDAVVFVSASAVTSKVGGVLGGRGYRALLVVTAVVLIIIGASFVISALGAIQ